MARSEILYLCDIGYSFLNTNGTDKIRKIPIASVMVTLVNYI